MILGMLFGVGEQRLPQLRRRMQVPRFASIIFANFHYEVFPYNKKKKNKTTKNKTYLAFSDLCRAYTCLVSLSRSREYWSSTSARRLKKSCSSYRMAICVSMRFSKHLLPSFNCDLRSFLFEYNNNTNYYECINQGCCLIE